MFSNIKNISTIVMFLCILSFIFYTLISNKKLEEIKYENSFLKNQMNSMEIAGVNLQKEIDVVEEKAKKDHLVSAEKIARLHEEKVSDDCDKSMEWAITQAGEFK